MGIQAGTQRRLFTPGDVSVPVVGGIGFFWCALDDLDFRVRLQTREKRLDFGHSAKDACERDVLLWRERLVTEKDHLKPGQSLAKFFLGDLIERLAEIQPTNNPANGRGVGLNHKVGVGVVRSVRFDMAGIYF